MGLVFEIDTIYETVCCSLYIHIWVGIDHFIHLCNLMYSLICSRRYAVLTEGVGYDRYRHLVFYCLISGHSCHLIYVLRHWNGLVAIMNPTPSMEKHPRIREGRSASFIACICPLSQRYVVEISDSKME